MTMEDAEFARECERVRKRAQAWTVATRFKQAPVEAKIFGADARTIERALRICSRMTVENIARAILRGRDETVSFSHNQETSVNRLATAIHRALTGEGK